MVTIFTDRRISANIRRLVVLIFLAACLAVIQFSCSSEKPQALLVAVSILPQQDFLQHVIGDEPYSIMVLIPPGASPETYALGPGQMEQLSRARAYFKLGSGLPFENVWLGKIENLNPTMPVIDCSNGVEIMTGASEGESGTGAHGEDPHIWLSPQNAMIMVTNMAEGMSEIDPAHKSAYHQNADTYIGRLKQLDIEIKDKFAEITNRNFIIFHPAWGYYAREFRLNQIPIEIEGKEPKVSALEDLVKTANKENIRTVFASPEFNAESARVIAREINGQVVFIDPLAEDYITNMLEVTGKLAEAMKQ